MRASRNFYVFLVLLALVLGAVAVYRAAINPIERTDFTVYVAAGRAVLEGKDIYLAENARGWRYVYPPPFAILLGPLARMPLALGAVLWYLLSALAFGAAAWMCAAVLPESARPRAKPHLLYGLPLLALISLLTSSLLRSQASPFMVFFMIAAFYFHLKERPVAAGFSLACAALLKVFPIVLIVYFILRKQWRAVLATAAALALLGLVLPSLYWGWQFNLEQIARWIDVVGHPAVMENTARAQTSDLYGQLLDTAKPRNQSLEALFLSLGVSAHLTRYAVAAVAALMLAAMWAGARRIAHGARDMAEPLLCGAFLCWSLAISPIAEGHYFGALLWPLIALTGWALQEGRKRLLAAGVACMVLVEVLTAFDTTAVWRPLCIATLALWLLCLRAAACGPAQPCPR